ncbi:iron uptake transporter permease EfeU [Corynebacterium guangdongense]|uniref:High-affinity iron transporter n=1 Tax=Corynebacterium guangdongense TaxID=1783348 RepID=A0ABU1ZUS1_9CORY|nr:iron uptake transporter permease EfeU [Corynebacterium guangdongense]MDR7328615.1 high-affinity iron transporter [Corynebacterium guangdongense]WJZ17192.1 Ferrous iron permease EfeU [Corynebacterium guangdongense]
MFFASLLIGIREGLEAALIISILLAYVQKQQRPDLRAPIGRGVTLALALLAALGALFTFGRSSLTFRAQEIVGGVMSLLAVVMITGMIFWMFKLGATMKKDLEASASTAIAAGGAALFWVAFLAVAREGLETTLMLWGWMTSPAALIGALVGLAVAAALGYLLYRGILKIRLSSFFTWSGALLIVVAAGILAYGVHDLQEAALLPGPFSGAPIAPTHPRTGEVLTGFATYPFWLASFPFGWAFNIENVMDPAGVLAAFLKGTVGFEPQMSWLQIIAWACYLLVVVPAFVRKVRATRRPKPRSPGTPTTQILTERVKETTA